MTAESTLDLTQEVIGEAASAENAVIIGRGAQVFLRELPDCLHVYIHARRDWRAERLMRLRNLDHFDPRRITEKLIDQADQNRSDYLRVFYKRGWREPELYDLMLDSSRCGVDGAIELLAWWLGKLSARPAAA